jgi:hypothetical protein
MAELEEKNGNEKETVFHDDVLIVLQIYFNTP